MKCWFKSGKCRSENNFLGKDPKKSSHYPKKLQIFANSTSYQMVDYQKRSITKVHLLLMLTASGLCSSLRSAARERGWVRKRHGAAEQGKQRALNTSSGPQKCWSAAGPTPFLFLQFARLAATAPP
jgi:hypothetical protein